MGDLLWGAAGQGGKMAAQIVATETVGDLAEQNERLQELMGARVGEAQARSALLARRDRAVDALEGILGKHAVVAQTFDFEKPAIGRKADLAQPGQIVQPPRKRGVPMPKS